MSVDISDYVQSTRPLNVLKLIDPPVLESFIAGYSHLAFSGVAVFFKLNEEFPFSTNY